MMLPFHASMTRRPNRAKRHRRTSIHGGRHGVERLETRLMLASDLVLDVTTTNDDFDVVFNVFNLIRGSLAWPEPMRDGKLSLREAIYLANQATQPNVTINLQPGATYHLTRSVLPFGFPTGGFRDTVRGNDVATDDLVILHNVTINGQGATINGAANPEGILDIVGPITVTMSDLTITNGGGLADAAVAVFAGANVVMRNVVVSDNHDSPPNAGKDEPGAEARGGGMFIQGGNVTIVDSQFLRNSVRGGWGGDADDRNSGSEGGDAGGGAIYLDRGSLVVQRSIFDGNTARGGSGGKADDSDGRGGDGGGAAGGAIYVKSGTLRVELGTRFTNNAARGGHGGMGYAPGGGGGVASGGAIYAQGGAHVFVDTAAFMHNRAEGGDGGYGDDSTGGTGGWARGGAIAAERDEFFGSGTLEISRTILDQNVAIGGHGGKAEDRFEIGGAGGNAQGGAVWSQLPAAWTANNFTNNTAQAGNGIGTSGGIGGEAQGGAAFIGARRSILLRYLDTPVTLVGHTFEGNTARGGNGDHSRLEMGFGIVRAIGDGGDGGDAEGGALWLSRVDLDAADTSFVANQAIAGDGGSSRAQIGSGGDARGGAIYASDGSVRLTGAADLSTLIAANGAVAGEAGGPASVDHLRGDDREPFDELVAVPGRGGAAAGGAIWSDANLTIRKLGMVDNTAQAGGGTSSPSQFPGVAGGDAGDAVGGAVWSQGTLTLDHTAFAGNGANGGRSDGDSPFGGGPGGPGPHGPGLAGGRGGASHGGAVYSAGGDVTVHFSEFVANYTFAGNGGEGGYGTTNPSESDNGDPGGNGGNGGDASAGALFARVTGRIDVRDSLFTANTVVAGRGGNGGRGGTPDPDAHDGGHGGAGGVGGSASGAAIALVSGAGPGAALGDASILRTTIENNRLAAGDGGNGGPGGPGGNFNVHIDSEEDITGETHVDIQFQGYGGNGGDGGRGGEASGGGIAIAGPTVRVERSTIYRNVVSAGWGGSGGNGGFGPARGGNGGAGGQFRLIRAEEERCLPPASQPQGSILIIESVCETIPREFVTPSAGGARGGGIATIGGELVLDTSTVFGNLALSGYGGWGGHGGHSALRAGNGGAAGDGATALGGGVFIGAFARPGSVQSSTIANNGVESGGAGFFGIGGQFPDSMARGIRQRRFTSRPGLNLIFGSTGFLLENSLASTNTAGSNLHGSRASVLSPGLQERVTEAAIHSGMPVDPVVDSLAPAAIVLTAPATVHSGSYALVAVGAYLNNVPHKVGTLEPWWTVVSARGAAVNARIMDRVMIANRLITGAPIAGIVISTAVIVGMVVLQSLIYGGCFDFDGDCDFLGGLQETARATLLGNAADYPKYHPNILQAAPAPAVDDDVLEIPRPRNGGDGDAGKGGRAEGPNVYVEATVGPLMSHTIVADGRAVVRERERIEAPGQLEPAFAEIICSDYSCFSLQELPPWMIREVVHAPATVPDTLGPIQSAGYNFVGVQGDQYVSAITDRRGSTSASLELRSVGYLDDNGGPTQTLKLRPDSPARSAAIHLGPHTFQNGASSAGFVSIGAWHDWNSFPTPGSDGFRTDQGQRIVIPLDRVLENDSDPDGDLLRFASTRVIAQNGTAIISDSPAGADAPPSSLPDGVRIFTVANSVNVASTCRIDRRLTSDSMLQPCDASIFARLAFDYEPIQPQPLFAERPERVISQDARYLIYTPDPDFVGFETLTYLVSDGSLSMSATITIDVRTVNDPPDFTGSDVHVLRNAGPQVIPNWAAFVPGGAEEVDQTVLAYSVTNVSVPEAFAELPTVSPDGTLRFTAASDVHARVEMDVQVQDSGGTEHGGQDRSAVKTFVLTIGDPNAAPILTLRMPEIVFHEDELLPEFITGFGHFAVAHPGSPAETRQQHISGFEITGNTNPSLFRRLGFVGVEGVGVECGTCAGRLWLDPAPNASGTAEITMVARDSGGTHLGGQDTSLPQTFRVTILPVNDRPVVTAQSHGRPSLKLATVIGGALHTIPGLVTFSAGPPDEADQQLLRYEVSMVSGADLFEQLPTLDHNGTLSFVPRSSARGTATIELIGFDDGGTAHGGLDGSLPDRFTLVFDLPVNAPPVVQVATHHVIVNEDSRSVIPGFAQFDPGDAIEFLQRPLRYFFRESDAELGVSFVELPRVAPDGTLTFTPQPDRFFSRTIHLAVQDDGGTAFAGMDTSEFVPITITVQPVNDPPSFNAIDTVTVREDSGPQRITRWVTDMSAGGWAEFWKGLSSERFTISDVSRPELFSQLPSVNNQFLSFDLVFTPAPGAFGAATFAVVAHDQGGTENGGQEMSAPQTFTIVIEPVNDAPSFTASDVQAFEQGRPLVVPGWATATSGADNETDQAVQAYRVTDVGNPALFATLPEVTVDGSLRFEFVPGATGQSTITLVVQDTGGVERGGQDTSLPQTFMIRAAQRNRTPLADAGGPYTAALDGTVQLNGSASSDPDQASDTLLYRWDLDGDGVFGETGSLARRGDETGARPVFRTSDLSQSPVSVLLEVFDDELLRATASATIEIQNIQPRLASDAPLVTVNEGQPITHSGSFSDSNNDPVTLTASSGTIVANDNGIWTWSLDESGRPGSQTITITATDSHGASATTTFDVIVQNVAPLLTSFASNAEQRPATSRRTARITSEFVDSVLVNAHQATVHWGDDTPAQSVAIVEQAGIGSVSASHQYDEPGVYTVTITITDAEGASTEQITTMLVRGIALDGRTLEIVGTNQSDQLSISSSRTRISVSASWLGRARRFDLKAVDQILVYLGGGNDVLWISDRVTHPVIVHAGDGNDRVRAGGGPAVLLGEAGDDALTGGAGRDILIGGIGADELAGREGDDILIGGSTGFDAIDRVLEDCRNEWNSIAAYDDRVANLRGGDNATRARLVLNDTVIDDELDRLQGDLERDWFFAGALDILSDRESNEQLN